MATYAPVLMPQSGQPQSDPGFSLPDYLRQQQQRQDAAGQPPLAGAGNAMKAFIEGLLRGKQQPRPAQPGSPMNIQSPDQQAGTSAWPPPGGGAVPYAGAGPWGTSPDPTMAALFTPPPQSPLGSGSGNAIY